MSGWRQGLARAPLPVQFAYFTVVFGLLTWLFDALTGTPNSWRGHLLGAVVFGALMTAFMAWQQRRDGGPEASRETTAALRSGQLPVDADPRVWRDRLDRHERTHRRVRFVAPVEFGAFALLGVWIAGDQGVLWWWAFAAAFALFGVGCVVAGTRTLRRIDLLRGELLHR